MRIQEFNFNVDLLQSLLWQYNEAISLQTLVENEQDWFNENQTEFWEDWITNVFDLRTANDFGLAVWSIILNIPLYISETPDNPGKPIWGFGGFNKNFENGNFANTGGYSNLTTEQKRLILRLRYFSLCTRGDVLDVNAFFKYLFGYNQVFIIDNLDMTITYYFNFDLPSELLEAFKKYDILPRPAAVGINYVINPINIFGFGSFNKNFENGNFINIQ